MSVTESEREMAKLVAACALTDVKRLAKAFQQFKQENYRRGFEAAKVAAQMIADEEFVRRNGLGNMAMVADFIRRKIEKLTPEVTE